LHRSSSAHCRANCMRPIVCQDEQHRDAAVMGPPTLRRTPAMGLRKALASACALAGILIACGGTASTGAVDAGSPQSACPAGQSFCSGCGGGGYCSAGGCPNIACPTPGTADGSPGEAGASGDDGGACPAASPTVCMDCSGVPFCVSGSCPAISCPVADAGGDAASVAEGAAADGPESTMCTLDGGECPAGWQCMCWSHTGVVGTYTCTCHKQCSSAEGCPADHALCGCGNYPGAAYSGLCVSNCECSCG
jgi:hypothetical protein